MLLEAAPFSQPVYPSVQLLTIQQRGRAQHEHSQQGEINCNQHLRPLFRPYSKARPPIIAVSSAVLGTSVSSKIDSRSACAPSPTAPIPSSVGIPRAEVKFPSEPPPVAASCS